MKTMLSIEGTPEELAHVLTVLSGGCACAKPEDAHPMGTMQDAPDSAEEKPKRTRRTKAEIEAARAAEEADAPAVSGPTPTPGESQAGAPKVTIEQLREACAALKTATDSNIVKRVITEAGNAEKLVDVKPENYAALLDALVLETRKAA